MNKRRLRKLYLTRQLSLSGTERTYKSRRVTRLFFESFDLAPIDTLHIFLSIPKKGEIDTSLILRELRERFPDTTITVPRVDFNNDLLEHLELTEKTRLVDNHWGISEPVGGALTDVRAVDLALVPMLCFDKRGFRVGHGKGYYDKFLSECRPDCIKTGLSLFDPVDAIDDIEKFDIGMNFCVTPDKVWAFR